MGQDTFSASAKVDSDHTLQSIPLGKINLCPQIDESLAIALVRHNPRYVDMTGMTSHKDKEVVRYAAYLGDKDCRSKGVSQYIRDPARIAWAKSLESNILKRSQLKKILAQISGATQTIEARGGIEKALDKAFDPENIQEIMDGTKQKAGDVLNKTKEIPPITQKGLFNFNKVVIEATRTNSPTIA